jgi:hypothetical protein
MNRRERRAAQAAVRKRIEKDDRATIAHMNVDELFGDAKRRVRDHFERVGEVSGTFVCVTEDRKAFAFPTNWGDDAERAAVFSALREAFRARRVVRYSFANEMWIGSKGSNSRPSLDPNRGEGVMVVAADRDGSCRHTLAKINRSNGAATLGEWEWKDPEDKPQSWLFELVDPAASDVRPKVSTAPMVDVAESEEEFGQLVDKHKGVAVLGCLFEAFSHELDHGSPSIYSAIAAVAFGFAMEILSEAKGDEYIANALRKSAQALRTVPDMFPILPAVKERITQSDQERERVRDRLRTVVSRFDRDVDLGEGLLNFTLNVTVRLRGTFATTAFLDEMADKIAAGQWNEIASPAAINK